MSTITLNTRKTVAVAILTVLLLIAAIAYYRRSSLLVDKAWLVSQPRSKPYFWNSCATPSAAQPSASSLRNFTVVTAYLNIGTFIKGILSSTRDSSTYLNWMWPYRFMQNGVVAYFDDPTMAAAFAELRRGLPTKVIMVNRSDLWAFSLLDGTRAVFAQPDYPKNHPKSTNAEYVSAMHAKYELMTRTLLEDDSFGSSYIAWMDVGIYRTLSKEETSIFMLRANPCLHDEAIMYARIYSMDNSHTVPMVMRNGVDWVSGNFFLARRDVMTTFCREYMQMVESCFKDGLANHDQSILLAMYLPGTAPRPSVPLQAIIPSGSDDPWFNMALQSRRDALEAPSAGMQGTDSRNANSVPRSVSCSYVIYT